MQTERKIKGVTTSFQEIKGNGQFYPYRDSYNHIACVAFGYDVCNVWRTCAQELSRQV